MYPAGRDPFPHAESNGYPAPADFLAAIRNYLTYSFLITKILGGSETADAANSQRLKQINENMSRRTCVVRRAVMVQQLDGIMPGHCVELVIFNIGQNPPGQLDRTKRRIPELII